MIGGSGGVCVCIIVKTERSDCTRPIRDAEECRSEAQARGSISDWTSTGRPFSLIVFRGGVPSENFSMSQLTNRIDTREVYD